MLVVNVYNTSLVVKPLVRFSFTNFAPIFMHFLSHYYTELPNNNPLFVAALGIPDLVNGFSKTYNQTIRKSVIPNNSDLKQVHSGILQHYAGDKWFHNSPLFIEHTKLVTQCFINEGLDRERLRLSVLAHITVELMIDRQIVLEHANICNDYYQAIDEADERMISAYFDSLLLTKEKETFLIRFQSFKQRRFLFLFKDVENIVYGLNRVYNSVAQTEFTEEEKHKFLASLNNIDKTIRYSWQEILKA